VTPQQNSEHALRTGLGPRLSDQDIRDMRLLSKWLGTTSLARLFDYHKANIIGILRGQKYAWVD